MLIAIAAAVAAGACFAVAGLLQQRVAGTRRDKPLSVGLLRDLATQRLWLAGIGLAVLAYGFQGLALAFGPLILVQPLIVTELIFAIPLAARLHNLSIGWRSWVGAVAVGGGLAVAIASAAPSGEPAPATAPTYEWLLLLSAVAGLMIVAVLVGRQVEGPARASLFALAGAAVLGAQSGLYAVTIANLGRGVVVVLTSWQTYVLIVTSISGLLLIQSAFQAGPLAASMPVVDTVELVVAVTIGIVLFDEQLAEGVGRRIIAGVAMVCVLAGIVVLDTSPVTRRLHRRQREEKRHHRDSEQIGLEEP